MEGANAQNEALEKAAFRKTEKRATMDWARVAANATAVLLERRWMTKAEAVFDCDPAVGEAELGSANCEAAFIAAEIGFVTERDHCAHLTRSLDTSRAAREALRSQLTQEDEQGGNGMLPPKPLPPTPYDPAHRSCRVVSAEISAPTGAPPPLPDVAPPPRPAISFPRPFPRSRP